ncbi:hypothetical protein R3P38DRAFT_2825556 [Favolaschia claudopus]|uniref:Transmembrane protein n=1 Tax=Favolaschia claudopus TaxID=2862362 RepID=A0AAW0EJ62_9AGAR
MLPFFSFFAVFSWFFCSHALLLNTTIDDTTGDPTTGAQIVYTPQDAWTDSQVISCGSRCPPEIPNMVNLGGRSYHNSTFSADSGKHPNVPLTAAIQFNGSAVYVYCALPRETNANADFTFYLDGVVVGTFQHSPDGTAGFDYTVPVYVNTSITPGPHTLTLQNGQQGGVQSVMILDSIVYTSDAEAGTAASLNGASDPTSSPSAATKRNGPSSAALAAIAVLILAVVVALVILGVCIHHRRRHRREIYAKYMPKGAVHAFPPDITPAPSRAMTMTMAPGALAPLPPVYAGAGGSGGGNWWVGRDQKSRDRPPVGIHRPFEDLDPSQAGFQHPPAWERKTSYQYEM